MVSEAGVLYVEQKVVRRRRMKNRAAKKNKSCNPKDNRFFETNSEDSDSTCSFVLSSTLQNLLERRVQIDRSAPKHFESVINILVQNSLS